MNRRVQDTWRTETKWSGFTWNAGHYFDRSSSLIQKALVFWIAPSRPTSKRKLECFHMTSQSSCRCSQRLKHFYIFLCNHLWAPILDLENVKEMPFEVLYSVTNGLKFFSFSSYSQISFHMSNGAHGKMSKDRLCRENSIRGESVIHPVGLVTIYRYQKFQEGQLY